MEKEKIDTQITHQKHIVINTDHRPAGHGSVPDRLMTLIWTSKPYILRSVGLVGF